MARKPRSRSSSKRRRPTSRSSNASRRTHRPARRTTRRTTGRRIRRKLKAMPTWLRRGLMAGAVLIVTGVVTLGVLTAIMIRTLPDVSELTAAPGAGSITILDRHDRVIAQRGQRSTPITGENLPTNLADAVLAIEDQRFYRHPGVDLRATMRAIWVNLRAGGIVQGGSTVTQQLAKNLYLTFDQTYSRKLQEMAIALWLEYHFTKDEILAMYLNRVNFGAGAYGAEDAAWRYFGKSAHELTIGEAAVLSGALKSPTRYSPRSNADRAAIRATIVLDMMEADGRISSEERLEAAQVPIRVSSGVSSAGTGWFADWILSDVRDRFPGQIEDLIVRTTLDVDTQRAAEIALSTGLADRELVRGAGNGALVAMDGNGAILALVGGSDYSISPYNRAISAQRQPGSAFKPFVYTAAFESGFSPDDEFNDMPVSFGRWAPENYGGQYNGEMDLEEAFARSSNSIAVQVSEEIGRHYVVDTARRLGIQSPIQNTHSLALGAYEVSPTELVSAYVPFMNGGYRVSPHAILSIEADDGTLLYSHAGPPVDLVLARRVLNQMRQLFAASVDYGTSRGAAVRGRQIFGKTGTTNDYRDAWFVGWSDGMAAAVWTGNDDNSPTEGAVGGAGPARIFAGFMANAPSYPVTSPEMFEQDPDAIGGLLQTLDEQR